MLCFKFYQNRTINEEIDCWGSKAPPRRAGGSDFKNSSNFHTERWYQPKPIISAFSFD